MVVEQTKKRKRQHWEVEKALATAAAYDRGVSGGWGGSLLIGPSATKTQFLEPQQIETPQLCRSSRARTSMHPMLRHCQQEPEEPEDPEEDMPLSAT